MSKRSFLFALAVSIVATSGATAYAKWRRIGAQSCYQHPDSTVVANGLAGLSNLGSTTNLTCPIEDSDLFDKTEMSTLRVHVTDGHPDENVTVKACKVEYSGSVTCSPAISTVGTVNALGLDVPHSVWSNVSGMAYVHVVLPSWRLGSPASTMHGSFVSN